MQAAKATNQNGGDRSEAVPPRPKNQDYQRWVEEQQRSESQGLATATAVGAPDHHFNRSSSSVGTINQQHHQFHQSAPALQPPHDYGRFGPGYNIPPMPLIQEDRSFRIPNPYGSMPHQQPIYQPYPPPNAHMNYHGGGEVGWDELDDAINLGLQYSINDLNQTVSGKQYRIENDIIENNTLGSRRSKKSASSRSHGETKIFAKTLTGKVITLYVDLTESVDDIKSRIHDSEGVPPNRQRLVFDGVLLQDGKVLAEYEIEEKSTIHLVYTG
jgi:hypothetical protein